jgi:hypothetical protein
MSLPPLQRAKIVRAPHERMKLMLTSEEKLAALLKDLRERHGAFLYS